jgi:AraC-like DNA-binding protein
MEPHGHAMAVGSLAGDCPHTSMRKRGSGLGSARDVAVQEAKLHRGNHRFDFGTRTEPLVNGTDVRADGVDTQVEGEPDVVIAVPVRQQLQDLALPGGDELLHGRAARANRGHLGRASARATEDELGHGARHGHSTAQELADRIGKAGQVMVQQVAACPGLDQPSDTLFVDRLGNEEHGRTIRGAQHPQLCNVGQRRRAELDDDGIGPNARQFLATLLPRSGDANAEGVIRLEDLQRATAAHRNHEHQRSTSTEGPEVAHLPHLVHRTNSEDTVGQDLERQQDLVTCFEFDTNRPREALAVYRLSRVRGVEIWLISDCDRQRALLSDLCSASLVSGPVGQGRCSWVRGEERVCRANEILLGGAGEIQLTTPLDGPMSFFTIFWTRDALEQIARELGIVGPTQWSASLLEAGPISRHFAQLRALIESGAQPELVEQAYRTATGALLCQITLKSPVRSGSVRHPGVRRAVERLKSSFSTSISLADLAHEVQMSKYHLAHCFRNACGVAPHRYQRLLRIQCARRLLESGFSVGDAANETGFADAPHLCRAFRESIGVSPAAWANAWRASDPWTTRALRTLPPPDGSA